MEAAKRLRYCRKERRAAALEGVNVAFWIQDTQGEKLAHHKSSLAARKTGHLGSTLVNDSACVSRRSFYRPLIHVKSWRHGWPDVANRSDWLILKAGLQLPMCNDDIVKHTKNNMSLW